MSALLLRWLNDELKLHQKVEVLERDASNGYIIAKVLHLHGLEPNFEAYENASTIAAKIHNMELLGDKFSAIGLPLPVNTRRAIMMEDRSAVLQFLLQLQDFLRRRKNGRPGSAKAKVAAAEELAKVSLTGTKSDLPPRDVEERFVVSTTKKFHPTEVCFHKGVDMAVHLRKFEQAQWKAENDLADVSDAFSRRRISIHTSLTRLLGLASSGPEQSLRAIPASDPGSLAHFRNLEKRVDDLDFRPSNNVKMMKELRKRRKAQLAAEKDRRMRRQKALADQKKSIEIRETARLNGDGQSPSYLTSEDPARPQEVVVEDEVIVDPRQKYLDDKRAELEENYARLRASGSAKRQEDMEVLNELRLSRQKKEFLRNWGMCSDAVDGLISLAMAVEMRYELDASIQNFLSCSEVWATLPLQSRFTTYDVKHDLQTLAESWALQDEALDTSWNRSPPFVLLSVFTEDGSGIELARRVSTEHHLAFLQLDPLVDDCVKMSYDPQKLGDQVTTLSDREVEYSFALAEQVGGLMDVFDDLVIARARCFWPEDFRPQAEEHSSSGQHGWHGIPEEAAAPAVISAWDCVVSISVNPTQPAEDEEKTLQASDSTSGLNRLSSSKQLSAEAQKKLTDEEQRARNEEQRAHLEAYWGQTTRHIQLKQAGLHRDVLAETFHLCIDVYTQSSYKMIPAVIECTYAAEGECGPFPILLLRMFSSFNAFKLFQLDENLHKKIREPMATIRSVVQALSTLAMSAEQDLESELLSGADSFQALVEQATIRLGTSREPSSQELREVSLGDMADFNRVAGNDFVNTFAQDPFPEVIRAVDIVYHCLPSICFILKDHVMQKLELLRSTLYDEVPFLSESLQDSGRRVVLSKVSTREAMSAVSELGGDKAGGGDVAQSAGGEVLNILAQLASEYSFHMADEPPAQQYALSETSVATQEITWLLQLVTLVCRFADRLRQVAGQLYASDARRLQQTVQDDIRTKAKAISDTMTKTRLHGHATWPVRDLELNFISRVAKCLPRAQKENFLTVAQLRAIVQACENWERSDPIAAGAFGGAAIASEVFVALVLEVAAKQDFPPRWKDASAVAALTLQQCSTRGAVSWRKFVWLLLCIQFAGIPSLEDILAYDKRVMALPATKRKLNHESTAQHNINLSSRDFLQLPLWFEDRCNTQGGRSTGELKETKELLLQLFATAPAALTPVNSSDASSVGFQ
ncbi:unnamed protein product [Phytophthora fragariaefolia]|uniref:Unnamed protein product n=1 Tax=Phytophthora fragariaefolia TaxID=1490495 RepID=A0A9W6U656_9STRA|nr:unnamed protein product [Phytophthora fragariaefolia]